MTMHTQLPKDPMMLLSYVNTMLRDHYASLSLMCDDMNITEESINDVLRTIDYTYDAKLNKFI